jgi:hypothetical protein
MHLPPRGTIGEVKTRLPVLALLAALAGCARTAPRSEDLDGPSDEERLEQTLQASEKGPSTWSPAVTIPLYPVLLVADTAIKLTMATYRRLRDLFGGGDETPPVPERVERQAEKIPKR